MDIYVIFLSLLYITHKDIIYKCDKTKYKKKKTFIKNCIRQFYLYTYINMSKYCFIKVFIELYV